MPQRAAPDKPGAIPGAIQFKGFKKATASVDAMLHFPTKTAAAAQDAALGALMGVLFGRVINTVPGLNNLVAAGIPRDALIGALAASATSHLAASDPHTSNLLSTAGTPQPRPDAPLSALV